MDGEFWMMTELRYPRVLRTENASCARKSRAGRCS